MSALKNLRRSSHAEVPCRSASSASAASQSRVEMVSKLPLQRLPSPQPMRMVIEDNDEGNSETIPLITELWMPEPEQQDDSCEEQVVEECERAGVVNVAFALIPPGQRVHSSEYVFTKICEMRTKDYMKKEGFIWADGTGKRSQGRKVQWRFRQSLSYVHERSAKQPTLEELKQYVNARFPELSEQISEERFLFDEANRSPQQGRWYKMMQRLAPFRWEQGYA